MFCSATAPVNQAAERIIFAKNEDGRFTAVVQIQYQGPSEEFAWVLPVPGIPEVEGRCKQRRGDSSASFGSPTAGAVGSGGSGAAGADGVDVLASGNVGPYDYVVIRPDTSFENVGNVVVEWLTTEGCNVVSPGGDPEDIANLLGGYMLDGMNLLAFRLTKGNSTGTIRPIWITWREPLKTASSSKAGLARSRTPCGHR